MILYVAKYTAKHHLGIFIIDEIQNLLDARGVGQEKLLNFLVTFANVVKIPLLIVGTPRALTLLKVTFREARRAGDFGIHLWDRLSYDLEWRYFLEGLWKYQWTANFVTLTDDLSLMMYEQTQGVHALVVRLFQLSQMQAIRNKNYERLSENLIKEVALDRFKLVAPMLEVLKGGLQSNNKKGDKKSDKHFEDLFAEGLKQIEKDIDHESKVSILKEQKHARNQEPAERLQAVSSLISLGFDEELAQELVTDYFDKNAGRTSDAAVLHILNEYKTEAEADTGADKPSLKEIIKAAAISGISPMEALAAVGIVPSLKEEE